jgi:hypothetical protein
VVVGRFQFVGNAHAAQVNGDGPVVLGQLRHDLAVGPPRLQPAVQQDERLPGAAHDIVQPNTARVHEFTAEIAR